ncbi:histidine phosphatase family protein, partial [Staphylococcus haemolyticus]
ADGETFSHVIDRIDAFMTEVSAKYPDQKIVLITHGFTIKAAVLAAIGRPTDMMVIEEPDNTSVTRITRDVSNNSYYLRYYNRVV